MAVSLSACGNGENIPDGASSVLDDILTGTLPEGGGGVGDGGQPDQPPAPEEPPPAEPPAEEPPAEVPPPAEPTPTTEAGGEPASEGDDGGVDPWVWGVIGVALLAGVVLLVALTRRRKGKADPRSLLERQQVLVAALGGWMAQGWVIESQGTTEAILRRGVERRRFWVDETGVLLQETLQPPGTRTNSGPAPPQQTDSGPEPPVTPPDQ